MFTGLVQCLGKVAIHERGRLVIEVGAEVWPGDPVVVGESIAINGVCLTVVAIEGSRLPFDLSEETYTRSVLGELAGGMEVNLERALRIGDRLGGHIVQGHVDATGTVIHVSGGGDGMANLVIQAPTNGARYLVDKGSLTVDGISLTVVNPDDSGRLELAIIPHTWQNTNLRSVAVGRRVNLEYDVLAKHVERLLRFSPPAS